MSNKLSRPVPMPIAKIATAIANTKPDKTLLKWVMLFWSGVTVGLALLSRLAIWPTSVAAPVATTISCRPRRYIGVHKAHVVLITQHTGISAQSSGLLINRH